MAPYACTLNYLLSAFAVLVLAREPHKMLSAAIHRSSSQIAHGPIVSVTEACLDL